ncbi:uncharacterized protein LOC111065546 [Drosophila obscura]|uniref:uncharacterized protein LOC111065546 n=1 Tax=Drosophila obscura TaxID=7282 RepID=UPI001BB1E187|nr:uncharacterized protein LOC111065546 [Drosophila obscura]
MSADECKLKSSVYEELTHRSLKRQLERNGTMADLRSGLHVKIIKMIQENLGGRPNEPLAGPEAVQGKDQGLSPLINQLMMEYFEWFGYRHTLETFKMETGQQFASRKEIELVQSLHLHSSDVPILVQLILRQQGGNLPEKKNCPRKNIKVAPKKIVKQPLPEKSIKLSLPEKSMKRSLPEKSMKLPPPEKSIKNQRTREKLGRKLQIPENSIPERCTKLKERLETMRTLKETAKTDWNTPVPKLVQNNRKLIDKKFESHLKKSTVVKTQMKENPKSSFHIPKESPESRPPANSSESDELPSYDEHSDTSSDIPDRHYYVELEPPEVEYAHGHGEEGPYMAKQTKAETLFQQYRQDEPIDSSKAINQQKSMTSRQPPMKKPSITFTKKSAVKRKAFEIPELFVTTPPDNKEPRSVREGLNINLSKFMGTKNKISSAQSTPKKSPLWNKIEVEEDEPNLIVSKPPCPDTHINGVELDSSSESNEDGGYTGDEASDDEDQ